MLEMEKSEYIPKEKNLLDDACGIKQDTDCAIELNEALKLDSDGTLKAANDEESEEDRCTDHGKDYQYFCKKHKLKLCGKCLINVHHSCVGDQSVSTIQEYTDELRKECSQLTEELRNLRDLELKLMREREDHKTHVHRKCTNFQRQIHQYREEINRILDQKESAVLNAIANIADEEELSHCGFIDSAIDVQEKLSSLILDLEKSETKSYTQLSLDLIKGKLCKIESLENILEYANNVKAYDLQYTRMMDVKSMLEQTAIFGETSKLTLTGGDLFKCLSETARWIPELSSTASDIECSSDVLDTATETSSVQPSDQNNEYNDIYAKVSDDDTSLYETEQPKDKRRLTDAKAEDNENGIHVEAKVNIVSVLEVPNPLSDLDCTVLADGRIVISANKISKLYVLGSDGKLTFSSQDFPQLRGITEIEGNRIALISSSGLFLLEVNASSISKVQKLMDGKFYSVSHRKGKFVLCGYNYVLITSKDGEHVSKIHQFGRIIKSRLYKPRHTSMDATGRYVYISDEGTQKIICSTVKGVKKWESPIRYGIPGGIISSDNIYVAVFHFSKIVKMSFSGEELALYNVGMEPLGLHITADGSFFITCQEIVEEKFLIKIGKISM